jgi:hypothetical protein
MNEKQQQQQQQRNERPLLPLPSNSRELDAEFTKFFACFKGKETEENWEQREQALQRIRQLCSGQSIPVEQFSIHLKPLVEQLLQTVSLNRLCASLVIW